MARRVFKIGRYRLDFERYRRARFAIRSGGQATAGPWREWSIAGVGSLILSWSQPEPYVPRPDRLHLSRTDPTLDAGPCDCSIGMDHDGPAALRGDTP